MARDGSIDWWCPMRFDHPSVFAALLDPARGGAFRVAPVRTRATRRRYVGPTNVLETTFEAEGGIVRVVDLMPIPDPTASQEWLQPPHAIVRSIEGKEGEVEMAVEVAPRFDYGRVTPWFEARGWLGFFCQYRGDALAVRGELPLGLSEDGSRVVGGGPVRAGERRTVALTFARGEPLPLPPLADPAREELARTVRWWEEWSGRCRYDGPWAEAVVRSALVLKLLSFAPSGAIVAAATTSLPENPGGTRNWDYRYCWLRDSAMTLEAMFELGYVDEGRAFLGWLLHATRLTWPELQVAYDVYGRTGLDERTLDHLEGYRGARPVRVGNGAAGQFQLDIYGEVVGAARSWVEHGGAFNRTQAGILKDLGRTVRRLWREPDQGIWETRADPCHHTHSKVLCWSALEDLLHLHREGYLDLDADAIERERDAIREEVEARGWSEEIGSYVSRFDGREVDASLLLLALRGYAEPGGERMRRTYDTLEARLRTNGLFRRYAADFEDGFEEGEGAFGVCSFWAAEYLARRGDVDAAREEFERVLACGNDVGLFAEEIDPETDAPLGNFPQAFTHLGLVRAALAIEEADA